VGKVTSLVYCDRTDIGRRRSSNQDGRSVLPANPQQFRTRGWLFMVADGMGAHAAGELASAIAADRAFLFQITAVDTPVAPRTTARPPRMPVRSFRSAPIALAKPLRAAA